MFKVYKILRTEESVTFPHHMNRALTGNLKEKDNKRNKKKTSLLTSLHIGTNIFVKEQWCSYKQKRFSTTCITELNRREKSKWNDINGC
jgi:hypothetical protein